ncbi:MAG: mercuric reductase [Acidobacteriota bacterium]|nr:mercuric reductase [Acidobacteriota bacterium]
MTEPPSQNGPTDGPTEGPVEGPVEGTEPHLPTTETTRSSSGGLSTDQISTQELLARLGPDSQEQLRQRAHRPPPLLPEDAYNREVMEQTHPPHWVNPEPAPLYDLVAVGGGTAGLVASLGAAAVGARVALVERDFLGGDCLVHGCVPSKALLRAARAWHAVAHGSSFGAPSADGPGNFGAVMERLRRLRAEISHHDGTRRFVDAGVDVFLGQGRFVAGDALTVGGRQLRFRRALVATGARPTLPPFAGLEEGSQGIDPDVLTSHSVFSLTELPPRLAVIGGGPVGCELAQAFARFGSRVTLIQRSSQLLPREDRDAARLIQKSLERDGVTVWLNAEAEALESRGTNQKKENRRLTVRSRPAPKSEAGEAPGPGPVRILEVDRILLATGRTPSVAGLGLEAAGVAYDAQGVQANDLLETTNPRIYAAGDVLGGLQFTHLAEAQARLVIRNALFPFGRRKNSKLVVPWCTYTSPELGHVGLYRRQARELGLEIDTLDVPLARSDRALLDRSDLDGPAEGFLRLHLAAGRDRIVGATLVAEHAGEILAALSLAISSGTGLSAFTDAIFPYPTQAEVLRRAADDHLLRRLTPRRRQWLRRYFAWFRR